MDALMKSAYAFDRLLNYEYEIVAGSKQKLINLTLSFSEKQFAHLIGLHKLKDLPIKRYSYPKLFEMAKNGKLSCGDLEKSEYYSEIEERLLLFPILETALDSNELMIKFKRGFVQGTAIDAEYIIIYQYRDIMVHYFIVCDIETKKYVGKSFFGRKDNKYLMQQQTFKVLKKIKINIRTGETAILRNKLKKM